MNPVPTKDEVQLLVVQDVIRRLPLSEQAEVAGLLAAMKTLTAGKEPALIGLCIAIIGLEVTIENQKGKTA